ncbi:hypothetical protein C8J57DRAFT_1236122 [Mycena rebaudengoi]|nr:hypothetical protein C8J57DRAFT_1236122 [Mycena rebaudengoi]
MTCERFSLMRHIYKDLSLPHCSAQNWLNDICQGCLLYSQDAHSRSYVSCEHYDHSTNRDHLNDATINNGTYDLEYIEAVLCEDQEEVDRIEQAALYLGFGPLVGVCTTVANASTQKKFCLFDHRRNGQLIQPLMISLDCKCRFRVFEPLPEYRRKCPRILVTTTGAHEHPVPIPTKTPPQIRAQILKLLEETAEALPDMTARCFQRHPVVQSFLRKMFPSLTSPTLADWHISLANQSHLNSFIKIARDTHWPFGTDWRGSGVIGAAHLNAYQDLHLPLEDHYIRCMEVTETEPRHADEDDNEDLVDKSHDGKLRIIVCMTKAASCLLIARGQYLQSDITFKRLAHYLEFELAGKDRDSNSSEYYKALSIVNRQTAAAHRRVFQLIDEILQEDTGTGLQWRHLFADTKNDFSGLALSLMGDQHRGQALVLAAQLPEKWDLHEPWWTIQELSPYDHLAHCFRICCLRIYRRIRSTAVSDRVRGLMRSLVCLEHPDWDGTLVTIREEGGKVGAAWVNNKINSKFIFPAICQEKSFIPLEGGHTAELSWRHFDWKGIRFHEDETPSAQITESFGVCSTYASRHPSENAYTNLGCRDAVQQRILVTADAKIKRFNTRIQKIYESLLSLHTAVLTKEQDLLRAPAERQLQKQQELEKKQQAFRKMLAQYDRLVPEGASLENSGSHQLSVLAFDRQIFHS